MDGSPRRSTEKHHSARRLFTNVPQERPSRRSSNSSSSSRRKLVLVPESDDPKPNNVVARLMGLDSPPSEMEPEPIITKSNQVQLQQLLKIKEPFLLRELLRETEDQPTSSSGGTTRKSSLMQKFTGFVKRRPEERSRKIVLSPVKSTRSNVSSVSKVSPIKSPIKRGLMLEAAVKFLDVEPEQESHHHKPEVGRRKFSLSRSSSDPCLSSDSVSGIKKLSKNVGKELSRRFGVSSKVSEPKLQSKNGSRNLIRSKSDLGLELKPKQQQQQQQQQHQVGGKLDHSHKQSFSAAGKTDDVAVKNSSGIRRLFGHRRSKDKRVDPNTTLNTTRRSSETSSLVRALLLRRKNTPTKPPRQRSTAPPAVHHQKVEAEISSDDLTSSSASDSLQFSDEFSDDSTDQSRSEGSGSPNSTRLEKSGQPSPVSVLEAAFVDDHTTSSCSSIEDSPESRSTAANDASSSTPTSSDSIINAILDISRIRCIDLSAIGFNEHYTEKLEESSLTSAYVEEVLTTSQRVWESTSSDRDWFTDGVPISDETFTIMENKLKSSSSGSGRTGSFQARKLMFHCVDEAVHGRIRWCRKSKGMNKGEMVVQVEEQIQQWRSLSACTTDQLVERDMSVGDGQWRQWEQQVDEIARDLECSILRKMIEEVVRELT